jgi:hypothetical protein
MRHSKVFAPLDTVGFIPHWSKGCWVLRTFGEGCPKILVIRAVMQLSPFLGCRSNNFFDSMH